jgi:large subunit ribosomal protein L15
MEVLQVLRLNMLQDNPGAIHQKRRKGRGVGSGRGKTCGRGHKGQKAKESIGPLFEGGQTPLYKLLPKRGFTNKRHKSEMTPLNLSTLQTYIDMGRVDPNNPITLYELLQAGIFKANAVKHGVKLLAQSAGDLKQPVNIKVSRASSAAIEAVERAGGTIATVHYNRLALQQLLRPRKFEESGRVRQARPPPKWQPYYSSFKNRGYLNPIVQMRSWLANKKEHQEAFDRASKHLI